MADVSAHAAEGVSTQGLGTGVRHGALATDPRAGDCPGSRVCGFLSVESPPAGRMGCGDRGQSSGPRRGRTQSRATVWQRTQLHSPEAGAANPGSLAPRTVPNCCSLEDLRAGAPSQGSLLRWSQLRGGLVFQPPSQGPERPQLPAQDAGASEHAPYLPMVREKSTQVEGRSALHRPALGPLSRR